MDGLYLFGINGLLSPHLPEREDASDAQHQVPLRNDDRPDEEQRHLRDDVAGRGEERHRRHERDEDGHDEEIALDRAHNRTTCFCPNSP